MTDGRLLSLGFGTIAITAVAACGSRPELQSGAQVLVPAIEEVVLAAGGAGQRFSQLGQSVATLPDGGFAAVWQVAESDIAMQWLTRDGKLVFPSGGRLVTAGSAIERDPVVTAHPTSGAFVAFTRLTSGGGSEIVVLSFDEEGRSRWPDNEVVAAEMPRSVSSFAHLIADPDGGVFVCFNDLGDQSIRCQHLDASGRQTWVRGGVDAGGVPGAKALPRGVADGARGLLVFWRNQRDLGRSSAPQLMEGQRLAPDGTRLWAGGRVVRQTNLASSAGSTLTFYDVVSDGRGGAVLAFNDAVQPSNLTADVVAQRVSRDGALLWRDGMPVAGSLASERHEATVASGDGGAFVAVTASSNSAEQVWLYRLGPDGAHLWQEGVALSNPAESAYNFGASGTFDGETLWMLWTRQDPLRFDLRLARFAADGRRLDPAEGVLVSRVPTPQGVRGVVFSAISARCLAVWDRARALGSADSDVYGALVRLERRASP